MKPPCSGESTAGGLDMPNNYSFRLDAQWTGGRRGIVESDLQVPAITFSAPPEFQGETGFWTPEHFFLAAIASCFVTTFHAIAEISKFEPEGLELTTEGTIEKGEGGLQFTRITLKPVLSVLRESDQERGARLLETTERSCLVARSLKSQVVMQPQVVVAAATLAV
jgi:peroxiredoxin-like protein